MTTEEEIKFLKGLKNSTLLSASSAVELNVYLMIVPGHAPVEGGLLIPAGSYLFKSENSIWQTFRKSDLYGKYSIARVGFVELPENSVRNVGYNVWQTKRELISLDCMTVKMI